MLSWSWPACSRAWPGRSGRPTAPTNSVSPVSTNHGSVPRRRSVPTRLPLSGLWPGVGHLFPRVAQLQLLAVAKRHEGKADLRGLVEAVGSSGLSRERRATGAVVGVHVGVDDVGDVH